MRLLENVVDDLGRDRSVTQEVLLLHVRVLEQARQRLDQRFLHVIPLSWPVLADCLAKMVKEFTAAPLRRRGAVPGGVEGFEKAALLLGRQLADDFADDRTQARAGLAHHQHHPFRIVS